MQAMKQKMKNSGIEWIGKIPEDWDVFRIKQLARQGYKTFVDGDWIESPYITDTGIRLIQTGNIGIGIYKEQGYRYISNETFHLLHCTEVKPGDVLICRLADPVGRACLAPDLNVKMITSVDVCILKPSKNFNSKFVVYFLSSHEYLDFLESLSRGGTRDRISRSMLGNINFIAPSIERQNRIVDHLDSKITIVDRAIVQKRKLIDLLKEKRTAIINRAVTRGLDENVELVDSGVEWIGKVPKGWMIYKLKQVARLVTGGTPPKVESSYYSDDEGIPWVKPDDLNEFIEITNSKEKLTPLGASISNVVPKGSVLVNCIGDVGNIGIAGNNIATNQQINSVIFGRLVNGDFGKYMIQNSKPRMDAASNKVVVAILNKTQQGNLSYLIPPILVQQKIARYLDDKLSNIDEVVSKIEKSIALLREYRTSLISHVVTGKVEL